MKYLLYSVYTIITAAFVYLDFGYVGFFAYSLATFVFFLNTYSVILLLLFAIVPESFYYYLYGEINYTALLNVLGVVSALIVKQFLVNNDIIFYK